MEAVISPPEIYAGAAPAITARSVSYHRCQRGIFNNEETMKNIMMIAALAALSLAACGPAQAADFAGPRAAVTVGFDGIQGVRDTTNVTYGVTAGYDFATPSGVIAGVEAGAGNVFDRRDFNGSVRLGYKLSDNVLGFGTAGYTNFRDSAGRALNGAQLGAGFEAVISGPVSATVGYRYSNYEQGVSKHSAYTGFVARF